MSVVGFDFGNQTCKIGVARRRGIDVLQNEVGHRSTPTQVAFVGKQRLIGNEAQAQAMGNAKNTIVNVKTLLGHYVAPDADDVKYEESVSSNKIVPIPNPKDSSNLPPVVGFEVNYNDEQIQLTAEQVAAAVFTKLKTIASTGLDNIPITDCVIGCPQWWTQSQRQALLDAANIAGLNVLRLMNETTAIALNYGIMKPLTKDQTQRVMFIDMGHSNANVSIVAFTEGKLSVEGGASDRHLGGRAFDDLLVQHFVAYIKQKYKMDPTTNPKAMAKLRKECERIKLTLSTTNKVPFGIEYFMNDIDVKGMIERHEFEALIKQSLLPRIKAVLDQALASANVKKEDLTSVEIVGGSVRIPIVQNEIQQWFGNPETHPLRKTCDTEESIARGCALMCAMLSPVFKVKDFETHDVFYHPVDIEWDNTGIEQISTKIDGFNLEDGSQLYPGKSAMPSTKLVSFNDKSEPFQLQAKYHDNSENNQNHTIATQHIPKGMLRHIGRFAVKGMPSRAQLQGQRAPKIKVRVRLDANGLIQLANAELIEEIKEETPVPQPSTTPPPANVNGAPASPEIDMTTGKPEDATTAEGAAASGDAAATDPSKIDTAAQPSPNGANNATPSDASKQQKVRVKKSLLPVDSFYFVGLPTKLVQDFFEREAAMIQQDKVVAETNLARNDLEAYVLDMRNRLSGDLYDYSTENERNTLNKGLDDMEAWLYEDGLDAQKSEYRNRLDQLKKIGDPITNRKQEADRRPETISSLQQTIQHFREWAKSTTDPKYSHISAEDRKKVSDYAEQAATWLDGANASFASLKPTDNPIYTNQQLLQKKYDVEKFAHPIVCKPAPKPTATPPPKSAQPGAKPAGTDSKSSTPAPGQQETKESEVKQEDTPMEQ